MEQTIRRVKSLLFCLLNASSFITHTASLFACPLAIAKVICNNKVEISSYWTPRLRNGLVIVVFGRLRRPILTYAFAILRALP